VAPTSRPYVKPKPEESIISESPVRTTLPTSQGPTKTDQEKEDLRRQVKHAYENQYDIPERILYMALESVLYDEGKANDLIKTMIEDDLERQEAQDDVSSNAPRASQRVPPKPKAQHRAGPNQTSHGRANEISNTRISRERGIKRKEETTAFKSDYKSIAKGPNTDLRKGPNDELLLTDYISWNGPNPELRKGANQSLVEGPQTHKTMGSRNLAKGPAGLAKGSAYLGTEENHSASNFSETHFRQYVPTMI